MKTWKRYEVLNTFLCLKQKDITFPYSLSKDNLIKWKVNRTSNKTKSDNEDKIGL